MKNFILLISIFGLLAFASCNNAKKDKTEGKEQEETTKVDIPETRPLNPFSIDVENPVSPQNLVDEMTAWKDEWNNKEISLVAWVGGGISAGDIKKFSNQDNPGLIVLKANLPNEEMQKMAQFGGAQHIILKGKVRNDGNAIFLDECIIDTAFIEENIPSDMQLNPHELTPETIVNAVDVLNSMNAWNGKEISIKGLCDVPMTGNAFSFRTDEGAKLIIARFDERFDGNNPERVVKTVKGKIGRLRDTGEVGLSSCTVVE
jgi:hypothetical protein